VVNPQNPKAPSKDLSANIVYIPPGGILEPHSHENEEVYIIVEGKGVGYFGLEQPVEIRKDMFLHFPSNTIHGIKNTSDSMMKIFTVNSPPVGHIPEWKTS
jgi:mannose-6-phosphate isomerase-like protein (cupin superfamily)